MAKDGGTSPKRNADILSKESKMTFGQYGINQTRTCNTTADNM